MSKKAYVFPGQGSQFSGMGKDLYESNETAKLLFETANEVLGFDITKIMFEGTDEELKQTSITQPAIFIHSVIAAFTLEDFAPDAVAGHSLGEFSALTAAGVLSFEDGLRLVHARATAMQKACNDQVSAMAAILRFDDEKIEQICKEVSADLGEVVVPANYNTIGQVVISGTDKAVDEAMTRMTEAGALKVVKLNVNGAFHSPLMDSAREDLANSIEATIFNEPICPIYQNVIADAVTDLDVMKVNLIAQ
ncbi:MAG: [acyl-carrier-protein] S-malonyltransferase, partial [Planctomycetota bacterium]